MRRIVVGFNVVALACLVASFAYMLWPVTTLAVGERHSIYGFVAVVTALAVWLGGNAVLVGLAAIRHLINGRR